MKLLLQLRLSKSRCSPDISIDINECNCRHLDGLPETQPQWQEALPDGRMPADAPWSASFAGLPYPASAPLLASPCLHMPISTRLVDTCASLSYSCSRAEWQHSGMMDTVLVKSDSCFTLSHLHHCQAAV